MCYNREILQQTNKCLKKSKTTFQIINYTHQTWIYLKVQTSNIKKKTVGGVYFYPRSKSKLKKYINLKQSSRRNTKSIDICEDRSVNKF